MRVLVVGLGSMGKRRVRLIRDNFPEVEVFGTDSSEARRLETEEKLGIATFPSMERALAEVTLDCVFASTSPLAHEAIVKQALNHGLHTFSELNVQNQGYDEIIELARTRERIAFLSSTFLYRQEIQWIMERAAQSGAYSYHYHIGQYLPDWHPWEKYNEFFVGDPRTNGPREILVMELPWLLRMCGDVEDFSIVRRKLTNLEIDYDDTYQILLQHKSGAVGSICCDVVSRKAVRKFELIGEDVHIFWDGTPDTLRFYDIDEAKVETVELYKKVTKESDYADFVIEDPYIDEIRNFFRSVEGKEKPVYSYAEDVKVLEIMDRLEA
ncbi:MAG: Gfo/Idh/MocA family oxidoreductase [bacterium]|nr:Gfo/Idh/MocA family oxidoreductase [bacterium]